MRTVNLDDFTLDKGAHEPDSLYCVMELAAYIAEEPWSDRPDCVSPVIATFLRLWNDALDDKTRQILKPYAQKSINTVGTDEDEETRAWMVTDWIVRVHAPAWLRLAGLNIQAEILEKLPELNPNTCPPILPTLGAIRNDGDAAWDAAGAYAAAGAAARAAAGAAAWAAAWDVAGASDGAAARAAGKNRLAPTVATLQQSALNLLDRMIEVGK